MPKTKYIRLSKFKRRMALEQESLLKVNTKYKEPLSEITRKEEIAAMITAAISLNFPKTREHALILRDGNRIIEGTLYKFKDREIRMSGWYDKEGRLVTERQLKPHES